MSNIRKAEALSEKQKKIIASAVFILFLIFCGVVGWFIGRPMIEFVSKPEAFRVWVKSHGILGEIAFIGMILFQVVIALVPGEPLEIGAGYAFGAFKGTILCMIGTFLGSLIVFTLVKRFGIRLVEVFFSKEKIGSLRILKKSKKRDVLMFLVFFLPGTPKDLITYFAGLTDIKILNFVLFATFARLPSVVTSTVGGSALGVEQYKTAIIVFAVTLIISAGGWLIYNFIIKNKKEIN
ncbi:MAG: VTT domain-containing protein [Acutalibacteraceae bacterium]|nr:VTT domain-containing protein [Acutalibacteraceae bacterium]